MHHAPEWVPMTVLVVAFSGIGLAILLYGFMPRRAGADRRGGPWLVPLPCSTNGISTSSTIGIFVQPIIRLSRFLWQTGDTRIIDGMPNGMAALAAGASRSAIRLQTGRVASYAFAMIIGLVAFTTLFLLGR